jgi:ABC-type nitrate/sulfonate/bicarbonate transport system permease component
VSGPSPPSPAGGPPTGAGRTRRRLLPSDVSRYGGLVAVIAFLLIWEAIYRAGYVDPLFLSSPSSIVAAGADMVRTGTLWGHLKVSATEFVLGVGLAVIIGIPVGLVTGWYKGIRTITAPFISFGYATPRVALLPLIIIWLGIGLWSKVGLVFLSSVFPILLNVQAGTRATDALLVRAARAFGANDRQVFRTVVLPESVPYILTGVRLGVGHGVVGVVVAELYAGNAGIGYLIGSAGAVFQTSKVFVGIFIVGATGLALMSLLTRLEARFDRWRPEAQ